MTDGSPLSAKDVLPLAGDIGKPIRTIDVPEPAEAPSPVEKPQEVPA